MDEQPTNMKQQKPFQLFERKKKKSRTRGREK
jgi:hypothetical protein